MAQDIVYDRTMTVEEAIEILNSAELYGPVYEAMQVIIKALSEQSLKHAHWEYRHNDDYIGNEQIEWFCSSCQTIFDEWNGTYEDFTRPDWEFCPHCGAIMDEEEK